MIVAICSGGPIQEVAFSLTADIWIGVDRGALYLIEHGIHPDRIVGDFDSVTTAEFARISETVDQIEQFQAEKDETDTDLALHVALTYKPAEIILTGVTGGRLDHYEAALRSVYLLQRQYPDIVFKIINPHNTIRFLSPGTHNLDRNPNTYISFFAYDSSLHNVTIRGLKYETTDEIIRQGSTRFTSNEIKTGGSISFTGGICLMITSKD